MIIQWHAHLPGVQLQSSREWAIGMGKLGHIPFDEWRQLDGTDQWPDSKYDQSQPVFYIGEADLPDDLNIAISFIHTYVHTLYLALLLSQEAPLLPPPNMSVLYLRIPLPHIDNEPAFFYKREIGPFEREWIVYGNFKNYMFDDARLLSIHKTYELVEAFTPDKAFPGVAAGLGTLELTARPEFWWQETSINLINGFVLCISAVENILLPPHDEAPADMQITPTFGQHAAVITSESREDLQKRAEHYSSLYRLRSRLVHGEIGLAQMTDTEWECIPWGRWLLLIVLLRSMLLRKASNDNDSLPLLLARAFKNADVHRSIFS